MRLRRRLSLLLAATAILMVAAAFGVTLKAFEHAQERQLDHALLARAHHRAQIVSRLGEQALEQVTSEGAPGSDLDELVHYSAIYRIDGTVVTATENLGSPPPTLDQLGWQRSTGSPVPRETIGLEFGVRGAVLRGVLVEIDVAPGPEQRLLLLAAGRGDLDADNWRLVRLMGIVLIGAMLCALGLGWLLGGYLSRSIERIAQTARRVGQGEITARVADTSQIREREIRSLAEDLNRMIDKLAKLLDVGRRFVSHAAHELRSPLAALRGELELALHRPRTVDEYQSAIRTALDDTERLIALAEDLLMLARLESAQPRKGVTAFPLQAAVDGAIRDSAGAQGGRVRIDVQVGTARILGRIVDVQRMIRNLIDNAVAHSPVGAVVQVRAELLLRSSSESLQDSMVLLTVTDQGTGVPVELRERIFEPFFRGESERAQSGAGLGLSIAREIAIAHGGSIHCEAAEGGGARFVAVLPLDATPMA